MLWVCDDCGTRYAPGLDRCPHCGSTKYHDQGDEMAKATKHQGASHSEAQPEADGAGDAPTETEPGGERPAASAAKAAWVDYAAALGADDDTLSSSKADIVAWVDTQGG